MELNTLSTLLGQYLEQYWYLVLIWQLPWKGVALWKSAKNKQLVWFIVLLVVNTLAILEILYLAFFQKPKPEEKPAKKPLRLEPIKKRRK